MIVLLALFRSKKFDNSDIITAFWVPNNGCRSLCWMQTSGFRPAIHLLFFSDNQTSPNILEKFQQTNKQNKRIERNWCWEVVMNQSYTYHMLFLETKSRETDKDQKKFTYGEKVAQFLTSYGFSPSYTTNTLTGFQLKT